MQQRNCTLDLRFWWPFITCDFLFKSVKISKFKVIFPGDAVDCIWGGYVGGVYGFFPVTVTAVLRCTEREGFPCGQLSAFMCGISYGSDWPPLAV